MTTALTTLPPNVASRGVTVAQWNTLCDSLFPGAKPDSVLMVLDYCKARGLDPMKKPCHIVPIWSKAANAMRDVVMPGIYEYRTTAMRTKLYMGHSEPEYGPDIDFAGVTAPEWCEMVMYRWHPESSSKIYFPVRVYFREVVALKDGKANDRWNRAPIQMMTKCCEAAGLRETFPDEFGGTHTEEEMYGKTIDVSAEVVQTQKDSQDAETPRRRGKPETKEPQALNVAGEAARDPDPESPGEAKLVKSQKTMIEHRLKQGNVPLTELLATFKVGSIDELLFDDMQAIKDWIEGYKR
jgi:phage recombination protein Bet